MANKARQRRMEIKLASGVREFLVDVAHVAAIRAPIHWVRGELAYERANACIVLVRSRGTLAVGAWRVRVSEAKQIRAALCRSLPCKAARPLVRFPPERHLQSPESTGYPWFDRVALAARTRHIGVLHRGRRFQLGVQDCHTWLRIGETSSPVQAVDLTAVKCGAATLRGRS